MNRKPHATAVLVVLLLWGCAGVITPSQHDTEAYSRVFAAASAGDMVTLKRDLSANSALLKQIELDGRTLLHDAVANSQVAVAT